MNSVAHALVGWIGKQLPAAGAPSLRRSIVANAAKSVEALAGAGDLQQAREFAGKILAFDSTTETRLQLQTHASRAGHPEILEPPPAP